MTEVLVMIKMLSFLGHAEVKKLFVSHSRIEWIGNIIMIHQKSCRILSYLMAIAMQHIIMLYLFKMKLHKNIVQIVTFFKFTKNNTV